MLGQGEEFEFFPYQEDEGYQEQNENEIAQHSFFYQFHRFGVAPVSSPPSPVVRSVEVPSSSVLPCRT